MNGGGDKNPDHPHDLQVRTWLRLVLSRLGIVKTSFASALAASELDFRRLFVLRTFAGADFEHRFGLETENAGN